MTTKEAHMMGQEKQREGREGQGGFTLLELLMVVIIIGILASVAMPQYIKASEKARAAEALSVLGAIRAAQVRYRAQSSTNVYTAALTDLDVEFSALKFWGAPALSASAATGVATMARSAGTYSGQTMGVTYGSGTVCGTFVPYFGATPVTCTAD